VVPVGIELILVFAQPAGVARLGGDGMYGVQLLIVEVALREVRGLVEINEVLEVRRFGLAQFQRFADFHHRSAGEVLYAVDDVEHERLAVEPGFAREVLIGEGGA